jgi:AcrR family transcriptional regulator
VDPRAERSRSAILRAAAQIIEAEGYAGVTHQRVAERAGVGRATVYRHWAQLDDLLFDAIATLDAPIFRPGNGETLREWLETALAHAGEMFASPATQHLIAALIDRGASDTDLAALRKEMGTRADDHLSRRLGKARTDGELTHAPAAADLAALLLGPLLFRALIQPQEVDDAFIAFVIDHALPTKRRKT